MSDYFILRPKVTNIMFTAFICWINENVKIWVLAPITIVIMTSYT